MALDAHPDREVLEVLGEEVAGFALSFIRTSPDCVKLLNRDGRISFMSENGRCAMEIDDLGVVVGQCWWDLWPDEARPQVEQAFHSALRAEATRFTAMCPTAKGRAKQWDVTVSPIFSADGRVDSVLSISREVL